MLTLNVDIMSGTTFKEAVTEAKDLAIRCCVTFVDFKFNGIDVSVTKYSDIDSLVAQYCDKDDKTRIIV